MEQIIVAIIAMLGSVFGSWIVSKGQHDKTMNSMKTSIALIQKDIQNLEKKQDLHNGIIERVYQLEKIVSVMDEKQKVANHRINDIEDLERSQENEHSHE